MQTTGKVTVIPKGKECHVEWQVNISEKDGTFYSPLFYFENKRTSLSGRNSMNSAGYISLGIYCSFSKGSPNKVALIFSLKTVNGKRDFKRQITKVFDGPIFHTFDRFLSKSDFKKRQSEFLSSGFLTVVCTLKRLSSTESANGAFAPGSSVVRHCNKMSQDFKELFLKQENCDVILRVKGREFHAHKAILIARSPVFASTFLYDMKEKKSGIIDIEDCDPSIFSDFLCFLYSGDMNDLSSDKVFSLFTVADKYDVSDLRINCVEFMKKNIFIETFCEIISLALQHTETELIHLATEFFVQNAQQILETVEWNTFVDKFPTHSNELLMKFMKSVEDSNI